MTDCGGLLDKLERTNSLEKDEFAFLVSSFTENDREYAARKARNIAVAQFGKQIYIRGIIEFSNFCGNDCYYCGLRCSNKNIKRYRLTAEQILSACGIWHSKGIRTFVLQSGEDAYFTPEKMSGIVAEIRKKFPDCAITLSLGELDYSAYKMLRDAGADRYLLRHESASPELYSKLHPPQQKLENRMECLAVLKELGFQTGAGFMTGAPFQTSADIADDLIFIRDFKPQMAGIGPFIPCASTPFEKFPAGKPELALFLLSVLRIMQPNILLPATTALGTLLKNGRSLGILAGANVVMPNITPQSVRENYAIYDRKLTDESGLVKQIEDIGYSIAVTRGDFK